MPGPVRVCLFVLFLAGRGGPASRARCGAPRLSFGHFVFLLCLAPSGLGLLVPQFFLLLFSFPLARPGCYWLFLLPGSGCRGPWRSSFAPPPPSPPLFYFPFLFFFRRPLVSGFPLIPALGALGLCALWLPAPPPPLSLSLCLFWCFFWCSCFFLVPAALGFCTACRGFFFLLCVRPCVWCVSCVLGLCPPPPPPSGGCSRFAVSCFLLCGAATCSGLACVFHGCFSVPCGAGVVLCGVLSCCVVGFVAVGLPWALSPPFLLVSCGALLCRAILCGALSCVVRSRVVVQYVVLCAVLVCGVVWWSGPLRGFFCPACPPSCCPLVPLPGPLSWPLVCVLSWGAVLCCSVCRLPCGVLLFASFLALGAQLLRSRWLEPCVAACRCWVSVAGSCCPLLFSFGVLCCPCSCLAAWLAALLCAVVCCGVPLPFAVYCVLWRPVVPCCPFCCAGGVALCPFPVSAVLCCAVLRAVRCRSDPCCCWCLALWCVAVCGAVSLGVLWCGGASLLRGVVCCVVVLCRVASCGAVLPCGAVLLACASCSPLLSVVLSPFSCCLVCWCGVLWCPAPCAVSCGAVLPFGALPAGCAVRLSALLVFVFPFVL